MAKFELYKDKMGEFRWRLKADNNQVIAVGEGYTTKDAAMKAIDDFRRGVREERLANETENFLRMLKYASTLKSSKENGVDESVLTKIEGNYLNHLKWRFDYQEKVFNQQLYSSKIIVVLLIVLILSGLGFAFFQLYKAIQFGDISSLETQMAIETAGKLSIESSIVGAVVLVISLIFFYLYLRHVHDVKFPVPPHVSLRETDLFSIQDMTGESHKDRKGSEEADE